MHPEGKPYQCRLMKDAVHENWKWNTANLEYDPNFPEESPQGETTVELFTHFSGCFNWRGVDKVGRPSLGDGEFWQIVSRPGCDESLALHDLCEEPGYYQPATMFAGEELRFW